MSAAVKVLAVVGGLLVVSIGSAWLRTKYGDQDIANKEGVKRASPTVDVVKTNPFSGMAACQKLEAAGVGTNCQPFEKMVKFNVPSEPDGYGAVMTFDNPVVYKTFLTSLMKEKSDSKPFGSAKTRTIVVLTRITSNEVQAKTKAVVDAL